MTASLREDDGDVGRACKLDGALPPSVHAVLPSALVNVAASIYDKRGPRARQLFSRNDLQWLLDRCICNASESLHGDSVQTELGNELEWQMTCVRLRLGLRTLCNCTKSGSLLSVGYGCALERVHPILLERPLAQFGALLRWAGAAEPHSLFS